MASDAGESPKVSLQAVAEVVGVSAVYILVSSGLISFNKYLLSEGRFPHALELTTTHMLVSTLYSLVFRAVAPSFYPTMDMALSKKWTIMKYIAPLGLLFALALFCANKAYTYSTIAFLQFCKEGNVAIAFFMSCAVGLQSFSVRKIAYLGIIILGCSLCAHECAKNIISELVMSGQGLKLDALTFVSFQAPCSLLPLLTALAFTTTPQARHDFYANWGLIIASASLAFLLNVTIAVVIKKLSVVIFVVIGILKDIVIVSASAAFFGEEIAEIQRFSFVITLCGICLWAQLKMQEQATKRDAEKAAKDPEEVTPLLPKDKESETA